MPCSDLSAGTELTYTSERLLLDENIFAKTHSGVENQLSKIFIKTGNLPQHFAEQFKQLLNARINANYELYGDFLDSDIDEFMRYTQEFLTYIRTHFA